MSLSTHVLDTERGRPAEGVRVELYRGDEQIADGATDADGRIADLAPGLQAGVYRIVFHPPSPFFRRVELEVELGGAEDLVAGLIFSAPHRVDRLVVGGEDVVRDGHLVRADEDEIAREHRVQAARLWAA